MSILKTALTTAALAGAWRALACNHPDNAVAKCGFTGSLGGWSTGPGPITPEPSDWLVRGRLRKLSPPKKREKNGSLAKGDSNPCSVLVA